MTSLAVMEVVICPHFSNFRR